MKLHGITVVLVEHIETGKDAFNAPVYETKEIPVDNVIVAPSSSDDIVTTTQLYGKKAVYTLGIPKGDTHKWTDNDVKFFGETWHVIGYPQEGIEDMIPLSWNKKVMVERYGQ